MTSGTTPRRKAMRWRWFVALGAPALLAALLVAASAAAVRGG
jgi:hypothetical protein